MPKRTNRFQQVVAVIQKHLVGEAHAEESALVKPTRGGDAREVDVLITTTVGSHTVRIGVEASKKGRRATVEWVEQQMGKHSELPTDKLVIYSAGGFTKGALKKAADNNVMTIAEEQLTDTDARKVLDGLRSIWPKAIELVPQRCRVHVRRPDGSAAWFWAAEDTVLFFASGEQFGLALRACAEQKLHGKVQTIIEQIGLRDISESMERYFVAELVPFSCLVDGVEQPFHVRYDDGPAPELHRIERVEIIGMARINVQRVDLTHSRLGDVQVAVGELRLGQSTGVLVASDKGLITMKFDERKKPKPPKSTRTAKPPKPTAKPPKPTPTAKPPKPTAKPPTNPAAKKTKRTTAQ